MTAHRRAWNRLEVPDLIADGKLEIGDGYRAKNSEMADEGLLFARAGNVNQGFRFEGADLLSFVSVAKAGSKVSQPGDVAFTSKGTVGRFAFVSEVTPEFVYSPQVCYWRLSDESLIRRRFLYYWMQGDDCLNQMTAIKGLTDMADYVSLTNQRKMWVSAPDLQTQDKILSVLSAYDDLIENNLRRIQILEELAQALYREWFVEFRFPGHESVETIRSDRVTLTNGWRDVKLGDLIAVDKGLSYKGKFLTDKGVPMINLKCINRGGGFNRSGTKPYSGEYKTRHRVEGGDIVLANTDLTQAGAVIGSPAVVPRSYRGSDAIISHHLFAARIRPEALVGAFFVYHLLKTHEFRAFAKGRASGTTVLGLRRDDVLDFDLVLPPEALRGRFEEMARDMHELHESLSEKNENLTGQRYLLLPQLISGELDVSNLDIAVVEAA